MVKLLLMNGAEINDKLKRKLSSMNLSDMLQIREVGHRVMVPDTMDEVAQKWHEQEKKHNSESARDRMSFRVGIYRGHPVSRKRTHCSDPGKLIRLPNSMAELKIIAGQKFGFDAANALVWDQEGSEIDSIEVIRDNDKLFIVEDPNCL
ncbi:unnamed protein product [Withania somnifera]